MRLNKVSRPLTVHFPYFETCWLRKWRKTNEKGDVGYEAIACFIARDVSEKYQSQIHRPLEH
jgi:hypothetical protein